MRGYMCAKWVRFGRAVNEEYLRGEHTGSTREYCFRKVPTITPILLHAYPAFSLPPCIQSHLCNIHFHFPNEPNKYIFSINECYLTAIEVAGRRG